MSVTRVPARAHRSWELCGQQVDASNEPTRDGHDRNPLTGTDVAFYTRG